MPQNAQQFSALLSPQGLRFASLLQAGRTWFVSPEGSDTIFGGISRGTPFATINKAIAMASAGDVIVLAPGTYTENVVASVNNLSIIGLGTPRDVVLTAASGVALTVTGQHVYLENVKVQGATGSNTIGSLINGDYFYAKNCVFTTTDSNDIAIKFLSSATAGLTASYGTLDTCYIWGAATGLQLAIDTNSVVQLTVKNCVFYACSTASIGETAASSAVGLTVQDCTFGRVAAGTEPTAYISLATGGNTDTGIVTRCSFPTAINGGKNTVSTAILWVGNFMTGGLSAAQPS